MVLDFINTDIIEHTEDHLLMLVEKFDTLNFKFRALKRTEGTNEIVSATGYRLSPKLR